MHTHIRRDCAIGYMILTFEVIKGHFRSNKFLWQVPLSFLNHILPKGYSQKLILGRLLCYLRILGWLLCYNFASEASKILVCIYILAWVTIGKTQQLSNILLRLDVSWMKITFFFHFKGDLG